MRVLNRLLTSRTTLFLYVVFYCLATVAVPTKSAAIYMAHTLGSYDFPTKLALLSAVVAAIGLFRSFSTMRIWMYFIPYLAYAFLTCVSMLKYPEPSLTSFVTFCFFGFGVVSLLWEKTNG